MSSNSFFTTSPLTVSIPQSDLDDLRAAITSSRLPPASSFPAGEDRGAPRNTSSGFANPVGSLGVTAEWMRAARDRWVGGWDWRKFEARINEFPNHIAQVPVSFASAPFKTHYVHLPAPSGSTKPALVLIHGWPGSFAEFLSAGRLLNTSGHAIVLPSLPGYFLTAPPPSDRYLTFGSAECAELVDALMTGLGYTEYGAQGGDWGTAVVRQLAIKFPERCRAVHFNALARITECADKLREAGREAELNWKDGSSSLTDIEKRGLERTEWFLKEATAYQLMHATRPSTLSHVVASSPLSLLAWNGEKYLDWVDTPLELDTILDFVSMWWLTQTFPNSLYYYRESWSRKGSVPFVSVPTAYTAFPAEVNFIPQKWADVLVNLQYSDAAEEGGHFAALERPERFAQGVKNGFDKIWPTK